MAFTSCFLLWSDFHAHNWKLCSKIVNDPEYGPINDRLLDSVNIIRQLGAYAQQNSIKDIVFAGDLFHVPENTPTDVISIIYQELKKLSKKRSLWLIPGNHDMALKSGLHHAQVPLSDFATVCTEVDSLVLEDGTQVILVPYREDKEEYLKLLSKAEELSSEQLTYSNILISHIGVQGAKVGSDYVLKAEGDIEYAQLHPEKYDAVFLGHFHEPQQLGPNGWYIGATHQHNWGDAGGVRGFLDVKNDTKLGITFDRVETKAPRFVVLDEKNVRFREGDFVRIAHKAGSKLPKLDTDKARHTEIKTIHENKKYETISLPSTMVQSEVLKTWVDNRVKAADRDRLLTLGLELLKEATDE